MTKSRTKYQREWRYNNPEKVRNNKNASYWNNPEKYRKKARDRYAKNKDDPTKRNTLQKLADLQGLSATQIYRGLFIAKHAKELFEKLQKNKRVALYPLYLKVKTEKEKFQFVLVQELEKNPNLTTKDITTIAKNYPLLTWPFEK